MTQGSATVLHALADSRPDEDLALQGIALLARFHGVAVDRDQLAHDFGLGDEGLDESKILLIAKRLGLKAGFSAIPSSRFDKISLPALAWKSDGEHFVVAKCSDQQVLIHDLRQGRPRVLTREQFDALYEGRLLLLASRASVLEGLAKFDFRWFVPAVVKYRRVLLEVLFVSLFIQLFALVTPLFFQVVMDKVLVHQSLTTLEVIAVGLLAIAVFDVTLNGLRTYVFSHTTSKIDVELGAKLFRHILNLPLAYFESRRIGETVARVRELENIRNFLTGQALTSVLDLMFTGVFLAVMFYYSFWLTLIVVLSLPVYVLWSAAITPVLRKRLDEKFARGAENQSFLVETISGIGTVKATAVDVPGTRIWPATSMPGSVSPAWPTLASRASNSFRNWSAWRFCSSVPDW